MDAHALGDSGRGGGLDGAVLLVVSSLGGSGSGNGGRGLGRAVLLIVGGSLGRGSDGGGGGRGSDGSLRLSGAVLLVVSGLSRGGNGGSGGSGGRDLGLGGAVLLLIGGKSRDGGSGADGGGGRLNGAVLLIIGGSLAGGSSRGNRGGGGRGGGRDGGSSSGRGSGSGGGNGGSGGSSAGAGARAGTRARAGEDGRARDGVLLGLVGIVGDTGISGGVGTGEGNQVRGAGAAGTGNLDLVASRVELGAGVGVGGVEGDDLVADEVLAGGKALGDGVLDARVAGGHEGGGTPGVGGALTATLLNLEPDLVGVGGEGGAVITGALGHVGDGRANVRLGPESPVEGDLVTSLGLSDELGGGGTLDTTGGVATALEVDAGQVLDGAVALDGTGDTLGGRARVRVLVGLVEGVVRAADETIRDVTVGSHQGCGSKKGGDSGLHFCDLRLFFSGVVQKRGLA